MPITILKNQKSKLINVTGMYGLEHTKGLWNTLHVADINGDSFDGILVGNFIGCCLGAIMEMAALQLLH